jgi:hypothetical protein
MINCSTKCKWIATLSIVVIVAVILIIIFVVIKPGSGNGGGNDPHKGECERAVDCSPGYVCTNGKCVKDQTDSPTIDKQDPSTLQIINQTTEDPLYVYLEYLPDGSNPSQWSVKEGTGKISDKAEQYGPNAQNPANDVGAGWFSIATLSPGQWIIADIPNFQPQVAWRVTPLKYIDGKPCSMGGIGSEESCGMPIVIESGKDMVGDMSAVAGVNFLCRYEMTNEKGVTVIDFNKNPCPEVGLNPTGCVNPAVDGTFISGLSPCLNNNDTAHKGCFADGSLGYTCWCNSPCPAATCNLTGKSLTWCDAIHSGQCANSKSKNPNPGTGTDNCVNNNEFTTYCYSHDDANSSPAFKTPYKMRITFRDLVS